MNAKKIKECMPTNEIELRDELKKQESYLHDLQIQMTEFNGKLKSDEKKKRENEIRDVQGNIEALDKQLKTFLNKNESYKDNKIIDQKKISQEVKENILQTSKDNEDDPSYNVFEEKQLLAINSKFLNEIDEEKERIAKLVITLNEKLQQSIEGNVLSPNIKIISQQETDFWKTQCEKENEKRRVLLAEIHSLRDECAMLRASIEQCNLANSTCIQTNI
uniref:Uncharacterized protein n=1 Tax=Parastrongyloides trichosuri TaxID=131310 RepID=A0A0N4ZN43_PARTI